MTQLLTQPLLWTEFIMPFSGESFVRFTILQPHGSVLTTRAFCHTTSSLTINDLQHLLYISVIHAARLKSVFLVEYTYRCCRDITATTTTTTSMQVTTYWRRHGRITHHPTKTWKSPKLFVTKLEVSFVIYIFFLLLWCSLF